MQQFHLPFPLFLRRRILCLFRFSLKARARRKPYQSLTVHFCSTITVAIMLIGYTFLQLIAQFEQSPYIREYAYHFAFYGCSHSSQLVFSSTSLTSTFLVCAQGSKNCGIEQLRSQFERKFSLVLWNTLLTELYATHSASVLFHALSLVWGGGGSSC